MARYMGGPRGRRGHRGLPTPLIVSPISSGQETVESDEDQTNATLQQTKDEIPDSDNSVSSYLCLVFCLLPKRLSLTDNPFEG